MNLGDYFDKTRGRGVLATADATGKVNAAVYARPYFTDETTAVFIMAERLTHQNLQANPWAAYLFMEVGEGYTGKRLYLKKIKEEQNEKFVKDICRKCDYSHYDISTSHVLYFNVEKILPLIGDGT
jgi:predicted nucleic-acid-binding Zn-ribbon protein